MANFASLGSCGARAEGVESNARFATSMSLVRSKLPKLVAERAGDELRLSWETPGELPFPMPVEVKIGDKLQRVEFEKNRASVKLAGATEFVLDPDARILRESEPRPPRKKKD